jgi:hypothetical protein
MKISDGELLVVITAVTTIETVLKRLQVVEE